MTLMSHALKFFTHFSQSPYSRVRMMTAQMVVEISATKNATVFSCSLTSRFLEDYQVSGVVSMRYILDTLPFTSGAITELQTMTEELFDKRQLFESCCCCEAVRVCPDRRIWSVMKRPAMSSDCVKLCSAAKSCDENPIAYDADTALQWPSLLSTIS